MADQCIGEENTTFREAISVTTRLTYTLRFLATGDSYHSLSVTFKVGLSTISESIPHICKSIVEVLAKQVIITVDMRFPENDLLDNKMFIIGKGSKNKTHDFVILFLKK